LTVRSEHRSVIGRWSGVLATTRDSLVSSDIIGDPHGAIADLSLTKVIGGDLGAVYSWYDNEFGFANTLLAHVWNWPLCSRSRKPSDDESTGGALNQSRQVASKAPSKRS
jgi:Glyceraldehyde 3-phosphate dehydrogenase, C-terminal domain